MLPEVPLEVPPAYFRFHDALFNLVNNAAKDGIPANAVIADLERIKFMLLTAEMNMATAIVKDHEVQKEDPSVR